MIFSDFWSVCKVENLAFHAFVYGFVQIVFLHKKRIAEWKQEGDEEKLVINVENLRSQGEGGRCLTHIATDRAYVTASAPRQGIVRGIKAVGLRKQGELLRAATSQRCPRLRPPEQDWCSPPCAPPSLGGALPLIGRSLGCTMKNGLGKIWCSSR